MRRIALLATSTAAFTSLPALALVVALSGGCGSSDGGGGDVPVDDTGALVDSAVGAGDSGARPDATGDASPSDTAKGDGGGGDTAKIDTGSGGDTGASSSDTGATGSDTGPTSGDTGTTTGSAPTIAGCKIFPDDNPMNARVDGLAVSADNAKYMANMHVGTALHPDWGNTTDQYGIPYSSGTGAAPQKMTWTTSYGATESDKLACADGSPFCYPVPLTAPIEGGPSAASTADRHVLYVDTAGAPGACTLYEIYNAQNPGSSGWTASNGAIFPLGTNALRPDGWTSADAAGLSVLAGLVRYDEVAAGEIRHAIRFTMNNTYNGYIHPATHAAGLSSDAQPPMGLRLRLKKGTTDGLAGVSAEAKVILHAMEKYGLILADNGSNWYVSGDTNDGWTPIMDGIVTAFGRVHGGDFEVVDTGPVSTVGL